jgi:hypothetical protein
LRAVSNNLAAMSSRSCILSPSHFALRNTTGWGERCLFGIGLSAPRGGSLEPGVVAIRQVRQPSFDEGIGLVGKVAN